MHSTCYDFKPTFDAHSNFPTWCAEKPLIRTGLRVLFLTLILRLCFVWNWCHGSLFIGIFASLIFWIHVFRSFCLLLKAVGRVCSAPHNEILNSQDLCASFVRCSGNERSWGREMSFFLKFVLRNGCCEIPKFQTGTFWNRSSDWRSKILSLRVV